MSSTPTGSVRLTRAFVLPAAVVAACALAAVANARSLTMGSWRADSASRISAPARIGPMRWAHRRLQNAAPARGPVLVGLATNRDASRLPAALTVTARLPDVRAVEVNGTAKALAALRAPWIRYVERPGSMRQLGSPNDPFVTQIDTATGVPYQWNYAHVGADSALALAPGDPSIIVGYVDSGVYNVPDLTGQIAASWYFTNEATDASDTVGHGTFVASVIGSRVNDGFGLAGFCGACRLMPFKVVQLLTVQVAAAITKLVDEHVRVINLSLGSKNPSAVLQDALNYAAAAGVLVVASSGNDGAGSVAYPAAYLQPAAGQLGTGLAVGASDASDARADFSNYGDALSLVAPGAYDSGCTFGVLGALPPVATEFEPGSGGCDRIFNDRFGNRYAYASGTSFSSPEVAGIAALVWSVNPALKSTDVAQIIEQTASRPAGTGWAPDRGWGVVNAAAAVALAQGQVAAPPTASPPVAATVSLGTLKLAGTFRPGSVVVATATVGGGTVSNVRCTVSVGDARTPATGRVSGNKAQCAWKIPAEARVGARGAVSLGAVGDAGTVTRSGRFAVKR